MRTNLVCIGDPRPNMRAAPPTSQRPCTPHKHANACSRTSPIPRRCRAPPRHRPHAEAGGGEAGPSGQPPPEALRQLDLNQLQTAFNTAIAAENYELAGKIRDVLALALGPAAVRDADWRRLGIVDWLAERAEELGFRRPTEVQRRAAPVILDRADCIIESETGSGKTLAFLLPALSLLDYPPEVYPDDLRGPQLVVVVPTRELGVQAAMLVYKLFGGSVAAGVPGGRDNMFRFAGPRGLRVKGLLLPSEVEGAVEGRYLLGAHVVVGTPDLILEAMSRGVEVVQHCKVLAIDEADACTERFPLETQSIVGAAITGDYQIYAPLGEPAESSQPPHQRPTVVMVGATINADLAQFVVEAEWLQDPVRVAVGARMRVPGGLRHRYIVVDDAGRVGAMARQLRADLAEQGADVAPARAIVFAADEDQARALSDPLRTVLWGQHKVSVLLPGGAEPIAALHSFRDNSATLLLATPAAARGLDLPAVSHVYNVQPPADAADYLHRAGRAGRIGAPVPGVVTTMASPDQVPALLEVAQELGLVMERAEALPPLAVALRGEDGEGGGEVGDLEAVRRALEDMVALSPGAGQVRWDDDDEELEDRSKEE